MARKIFSSVIRLRRDADYNYARIENDFIPASGEVCLVDRASGGLGAKVGDGITSFANLEYTDAEINKQIKSIVIRGYYYDEEFYFDIDHTQKAEPEQYRVYIDVPSSSIYSYNGESYEALTEQLPYATSEIAGIAKLYNETGSNTDGSMTQKAITDVVDQKVSALFDEVNEMIIFTTESNE